MFSFSVFIVLCNIYFYKGRYSDLLLQELPDKKLINKTEYLLLCVDLMIIFVAWMVIIVTMARFVVFRLDIFL